MPQNKVVKIPDLEDLYYIYRVRKVRKDPDDATRVVEVHTLDLRKKADLYTALEFENGWHVLGYIPNITDRTKIVKLIEKFEKGRKK